MSQILTDNDDTRSVAASDFVQLEFDQPDEVSDQDQEVQHQLQPELPQFGLHQNTLDWTMNSGSARDYDNDDLKEQKLMMMITNLEDKNKTLQAKVENLELKAENRAMKESSEQKENYQELKAKINELVKLLTTQSDQHQMKVEQLETKNQKLEERLSTLELQTKGTTENGVSESETLNGKMEQLKDEFAIMLTEQLKQKQMMKQFNSLELKLKEAEQRAQMEKNKFEEIIRASQKNMEKFVDQVIGNNQVKLDFMWGHLLTKSKILANPKGTVWSEFKTKEAASISRCGLNATSSEQHIWQGLFATKGYLISAEQCRKENFQFPGTIVFYFEVKITTTRFSCFSVGFTDTGMPAADGGIRGCIGRSPNCYGIAKQDAKFYGYWLSGKGHDLACSSSIGSTDAGNAVVGCGIWLNPKNELAIFFTLDGILLLKTRISPTVDRLYPTVDICAGTSVEANFGDNLVAKPFKYDIDKCPAWVFE